MLSIFSFACVTSNNSVNFAGPSTVCEEDTVESYTLNYSTANSSPSYTLEIIIDRGLLTDFSVVGSAVVGGAGCSPAIPPFELNQPCSNKYRFDVPRSCVGGIYFEAFFNVNNQTCEGPFILTSILRDSDMQIVAVDQIVIQIDPTC